MWARPSLFLFIIVKTSRTHLRTHFGRDPVRLITVAKLAPNYLVELLVKKEWLSFLDNVCPGFLARPGRGEFELRSLFGDLLFGIGKIVP